MTPREEKQILTLNDRLSKDVQIGLVETEHEKTRSIRQFCDDLIQLVPKIRVIEEEGDPDEVPAIKIHNGLRYQAIPSGTEVAPFIEALKMLDSATAQIDETINDQLASVDLPTSLIIYVAPQCKFCPAFYEVLTHPKWPVRLGAMVVMEELIEINLDLATQTLKPLWERFNKVDNRVKGDLLYIFGQMKTTDLVPRLQAILNGNYDPEVQEAAQETLDKVNTKVSK
jgi:hypothetical protein